MSVLFILSNFLKIDFCNPSNNYWSGIFSFLMSPVEADLSVSKVNFLSQSLESIEARPLWYPSYFGFIAIFNALSPNI